jgi:hypothetical protein
MLTIVATVIITGIATMITVVYTNRGNRKILESNRKVLEKLVRLTEVNTRCLLKIDFGLTANAFVHGWRRKDEVESEEDAKKLGEPYIYDKELKVCFYKQV